MKHQREGQSPPIAELALIALRLLEHSYGLTLIAVGPRGLPADGENSRGEICIAVLQGNGSTVIENGLRPWAGAKSA